MIRLDLGTEPAALQQMRDRKLAAALELFDAHGADSKLLKDALTGYREPACKELYLRQRKRCAYCERRIGLDGTPVEHFRPKRESKRTDACGEVLRDVERYWWLAWSWSNLVIACVSCNTRKKNWFDLEQGTYIATSATGTPVWRFSSR